MGAKRTTEERFWEKVEKTDTCWFWTAGICEGFGQFLVSWKPKRNSLAHRYSYELHFGTLPDNRRVEHTCGSRLCVKPEHLVARTEEERFWAFVCKLSESLDGCWIWTGGLDEDNYGLFTTSSPHRMVKAHRYSWELANSFAISTPTLQVCHTCDNPPCVNPSHLFLGTGKDNAMDRISKGRGALGIKHPRAKLTEENVHFIRESSLGHTELARMLGVSISAVFYIRKGLTWKSLAVREGTPRLLGVNLESKGLRRLRFARSHCTLLLSKNACQAVRPHDDFDTSGRGVSNLTVP